MKLIEPSVELWQQATGIQGMYDHIERCARVCYRSENKGGVTSEQFVQSLIKRGHLRPLEFGTVVFPQPKSRPMTQRMIDGFNPYVQYDGEHEVMITNLRHIVEYCPNDWQVLIKEANWEANASAFRSTVHWHISRGIADEFRTHVSLSSLMESTRYVNYGKLCIDIVRPTWIKDCKDPDWRYNFMGSVQKSIDHYNELLHVGLQPQQAREVLPLCTATHLVQCGFHNAWDNFLRQRTDKAAHPDAQFIANQLKEIMK